MAVAAGFPERDRSLKRDALVPVGVLAESPSSVASVCLAFDEIGAPDWASYGRWGSYADRSMRRAWVRHQQPAALVLAMTNMLGSRTSGEGGESETRGWLNLVVRPDATGNGSTIEITAELDAAMYVAVRSVVRGLFLDVVRVWDPTR